MRIAQVASRMVDDYEAIYASVAAGMYGRKEVPQIVPMRPSLSEVMKGLRGKSLTPPPRRAPTRILLGGEPSCRDRGQKCVRK